MSLLHHPSAELLLSYAAGGLDEAPAVLTATHLALCPRCRRAVAQAEAVAGGLLHTQQPTGVSANALPAVMARLEEASVPVQSRSSDVGDARLPQPLRAYVVNRADLRWRWRGVGVRYLPVKSDAGGNRLALLEVAPGMAMPHHGHSDRELTMVLAGGYSDEYGSYARGDVQSADSALRHRPVADAGDACLCLIVTRGSIKPTGFIARCLTPFLPI